MAGASTDQVRVCLAAPPPASATLPVLSTGASCDGLLGQGPANPDRLPQSQRPFSGGRWLIAVRAARAPAGLERGGDRSAGPAGGRAARGERSEPHLNQ
jgi:hypothetical protein